MTKHTELLKFMVGAIDDWKEQRITAGRLFEIFRVNYFEAYPKLLHEQARTGKWFDLPPDRIAALLLSCQLFVPGLEAQDAVPSAEQFLRAQFPPVNAVFTARRRKGYCRGIR